MITQADLEQQGVLFPKLFRRLSEFLAQQQPAGMRIPAVAGRQRGAGP
jgi:hypothetical protein